MKVSTIKKTREMILAKTWKTALGHFMKLGFLIRRDEKSVNSKPRGRISDVGPRKYSSCMMENIIMAESTLP